MGALRGVRGRAVLRRTCEPGDEMLPGARRERARALLRRDRQRRREPVLQQGTDGRRADHRADGAGGFVRHATLRDAVDALGLWELPWLRPELAAHRHGVTWEQRWARHAALTGTAPDEACERARAGATVRA